jgi:hypothetical protein
VVLDFLADPRNEPNYNPLILAARKTTSGPIGLGTRYVQQVKSFGRVGDVDIEIVEYQRLGHLAFDICSAGMQVRGDLLLAAEGSALGSSGTGASTARRLENPRTASRRGRKAT